MPIFTNKRKKLNTIGKLHHFPIQKVSTSINTAVKRITVPKLYQIYANKALKRENIGQQIMSSTGTKIATFFIGVQFVQF